MTPNQITMLIILIAYMAVVLAVGLYASRRVKGSEDFLLAGRSMGLFGPGGYSVCYPAGRRQHHRNLYKWL